MRQWVAAQAQRRLEVQRQAEARRDRLRELARPVRVALVGCGVRKRLDPQPARRLYIGSLFRAALDHAGRTADETWILSARHGLLTLDEVVAPYDLAMKSLRQRERASWAHRVAAAIADQYSGLDVELSIYAGRAYTDPLRLALLIVRPRLQGDIRIPLAGLILGERLAWFKAARPTTPIPSHVCWRCRRVLLQVSERGGECSSCIERRQRRRKKPT